MKNLKFQHLAYICLILFLLYSLGGSLRLFLKARQNLSDAQQLLGDVSKANTDLHNQLVAVGKQIYIEQIARDTLGLAHENEVVFILPSAEQVKSLSPRLLALTEDLKIQPEKPHWQEWAHLFE